MYDTVKGSDWLGKMLPKIIYSFLLFGVKFEGLLFGMC